MSTMGNINIRVGDIHLRACISNDGYPSNVIRLIDNFLSLKKDKQNLDGFIELYNKDYQHLPKDGPWSTPQVIDDLVGAVNWDFELMETEVGGFYEFRCIHNGPNAKNPGEYVTPFAELDFILPEYVDEISQKIEDALVALSRREIFAPDVEAPAGKEVEIHETRSLDDLSIASIGKSWVAVYSSGAVVGFDSEKEACAHQREVNIRLARINACKMIEQEAAATL